VGKHQWGTAAAGNQEFHLALCDFADMPHLKSTLKGFWLRMGPLVACYYDSAPKGLNAHHRRLLQAMDAGEPVAARKAMQDDIASAKAAMLEQIAAFRTKHAGKIAA
jgi:DNA-binding GntR family transcriptional regulator